MDEAVEQLLFAARVRLTEAGYPADDLSDEDVSARIVQAREATAAAYRDMIYWLPQIAGAHRRDSLGVSDYECLVLDMMVAMTGEGSQGT